jgi:hypothetical protein
VACTSKTSCIAVGYAGTRALVERSS